MNTRRRKKYKLPLSFRLVLMALVLIVIGGYLGKEKFQSEYNLRERIGNFYVEDKTVHRVEGFAKDLAVLSDIEIADIDYTAEAGLITKRGGGEVRFSKNPLKRMNPASTTKIMTMLVALEYGDLSQKVRVGEEVLAVEKGSSLAGLKPGDTLTLEQLLYALMLPSGNDAANAIAVYIAGSQESFCQLMNQKSKDLGAIHTQFQNPSGLTNEGHYTTAYDLYLIINAALKQEVFQKITGSESFLAEYTQADGSIKKKTWFNGNKFLSEIEEPEGVIAFAGKTGTTSAAGNCLVLASKEAEIEYISVVLKAENKAALYDNMYNLLEKYTE